MTRENLQHNAGDEVSRGREALQGAEQLFRSRLYYEAASRAYYAVFHFARALAWAAGETPKTHQGVAHSLRIHYIWTGKLSPDTDRRYGAIQNFREQADYDETFTLDPEGARLALEDTQLLTKRMELLLQESGALG